MKPKEAVGKAEQRFLQAISDLAAGEAKVAVSFREVQEFLSYADGEASHCCDFWADRGAIEWPALGHIALTHLGLARAERNGSTSTNSYHNELIPGRYELGQDEADSHWDTRTESVSVVIPVLNEAQTIDHLVRLVRRNHRVLEVLVVDDGSVDGTAEVASRAGARVMMSSLLGKGASMEDGVGATHGEIVLFLDGDLLEIGDDFVEKMIGPILAGEADLVKATFARDAGRVTVLTARPLLGAFFPELAGFGQPLGGIAAARRSLLANVRLENDYGVDVGLLIDAVAKGARVVEVDIGRIDHESQSLEALGDMAKQVTQVILERAWRYERLSINQVLEMRETERRTKADLLPLTCCTPGNQKFALFDMDGVLLDGRFVVELADRVGAQPELSRLLDSKILPDRERSRAIACLFAGVQWEVFEETARSMPLMKGAVDTVVALRRAGYRVGIVTDSFHVAAETIRRRVFADFTVAHVMRFRNHTATGEVALSPLMLDANGCREHDCCKSNVMRHLQATAGLVPKHTLAVGDGSNDICMLRDAGMSVAFRPKSKLVERAAKHTLSESLLDILDLLVPEGSPRVRKTGSMRKARIPVSALLAERPG
jgi:glucosyl-3-phosphoglycerate synthase